MQITPGQIVAAPDEHVILTGPIAGTVTTKDGTTIDVGPVAVAVPDDKAAEVAHLIGLRYAAESHPNDSTFAYEAPKKFAKYVPHADNATLKGK